jgi:hypothetical protein
MSDPGIETMSPVKLQSASICVHPRLEVFIRVHSCPFAVLIRVYSRLVSAA